MSATLIMVGALRTASTSLELITALVTLAIHSAPTCTVV